MISNYTLYGNNEKKDISFSIVSMEYGVNWYTTYSSYMKAGYSMLAELEDTYADVNAIFGLTRNTRVKACYKTEEPYEDTYSSFQKLSTQKNQWILDDEV